MKRLIVIVATLAALAGCATFPHAQRPANLYEAAQQIVSSTGAVVARAAHSAGRYGATFGATGGSEVGSFPNAAPLNGSERILADQNATTVNLTPAQIAQYLGIPNGLTFPLSVANGGTGTATPGLVAGSNITITGSWPDQTIASTGGATPGGSSGSIQWNNGGVLAGLSVGAGQILQGGSTPTATSTPTLGASGTLGTLTFGNATSGTETITPPTGALGTLTITLPGSSGTLALTSGNVATATALASTPTTCLSTQAATGILANGNATGCFTPSGSGTVTDGSGTTTANELLLSSTTAHAYTNATTLPTSAMPALTGDVTSSAGSTATTVSKVNGASPPTNANVGGWNGSGQPVAATAAQILATVNGQTCNPQTGTTYTFVLGDANNCVTMTNAAANTVTIPANSSVAFPVGTTLTVIQTGAGATTVQGAGTPVTLQSAKYGSSTTQTYAFAAEYSCESYQKTATDTWFVSECDYNPGSGSGVSSFTGDSALISNSGSTGAVTVTLANTGVGYGVWGNTGSSSAAPGYHALSSYPVAAFPSGITQTIGSGTATLGTTAIASGACATVVTVAATGVATTDVIHVGFNGDPTAVTGYGASATGAVLTIYPYPTAGNVNFKVCNSTASSITPGALTLNWRVTR